MLIYSLPKFFNFILIKICYQSFTFIFISFINFHIQNLMNFYLQYLSIIISLLRSAIIITSIFCLILQVINKINMPEKQKDSNVNEFNKFLENNNDFLQEKYSEYFKKKPIPVKDISKQAAIKFIYDVFSFQKYESDPKMNDTLRTSLIKNIEEFSASLVKKKKQFDDKTAVEMLKFCIENNEMFAVKYDKKDKKMKTEEKPEQPQTPQNQQQTEQNKQNQEKQEQKNQQPHEQQDEQPQKEQHQKQHRTEQIQEQQNNFGTMNQFGVTEPSPKKADAAMVKKNLKIVFEFYCRQQQNVGANTTFDRISHECHTMTLGKFLSFCLVAELKNDKIDKTLIIRKFKLIAEGKKQIQFQHFYELIQILAGIDDSIIPKLGVDDRMTFKNKMKERLRAFNTQDTTSRDIRRDGVFIPKLTAHSGKPSDALAEQMKIRKINKTAAMSTDMNRQSKQALSYKQKTPYKNQQSRYNSSIKKQSNIKDISQIMTPKDITSSQIRDFEDDLSFLDKMINAQENDEEWLKDYKIPIKKRALPPSLPTSALPPRLNPRKQSIVSDIKKRVQEIQKTETRQSMHMERRKANQNYRTRNSNSILK